MDIKSLVPVDYSNQRVLLTAQVAQGLACSVDQIKWIYSRHKAQFEEGVHFFYAKGDALRELKKKVANCFLDSAPFKKGSEKISSDATHFALSFGKGAKCLKLWTEQGVARLSKLIDTPQAWEMMDKLKIEYFAVEDADKPALSPQVVEIEGVRGYLDRDNTVWLNAADVARELGFVHAEEKVSPTFGRKPYTSIRWERVNEYLAEFEFPPVDKDSFIPESEFYLLAMKAKNEKAKKFQWKVASKILPSIRKYGFYSEKPVETSLFPDEEPVKKIKRRPTPELAVVYAALLSNLLVKIGYTKDLTERLKDLQKETKADILKWAASAVMTRDDAILLERALKVKFFDNLVAGELFNVDFDAVKAAIAPDDKVNRLLAIADRLQNPDEKDKLLLQAACLL